jgi:hypothetical protein
VPTRTTRLYHQFTPEGPLPPPPPTPPKSGEAYHLYRTRMSKRTSYNKIYCPDVHFVRTSVDVVLTSPFIPRTRFILGRVFTVRADGKKRVCADAPMRPCGPVLFNLPARLPLAIPHTSSLALPRVRVDGLMRPRKCSKK